MSAPKSWVEIIQFKKYSTIPACIKRGAVLKGGAVRISPFPNGCDNNLTPNSLEYILLRRSWLWANTDRGLIRDARSGQAEDQGPDDDIEVGRD